MPAVPRTEAPTKSRGRIVATIVLTLGALGAIAATWAFVSMNRWLQAALLGGGTPIRGRDIAGVSRAITSRLVFSTAVPPWVFLLLLLAIPLAFVFHRGTSSRARNLIILACVFLVLLAAAWWKYRWVEVLATTASTGRVPK